MDAKEEAERIVKSFDGNKINALICVVHIKTLDLTVPAHECFRFIEHWLEVQREIEKIND